MRKEVFVSGEYYHIYNRGVDKREIFLDQHDLSRFALSMVEFNGAEPIGSIYEHTYGVADLQSEKSPKSNQLVNIIAYCLNPNHYHFILEQVSENGISKFMHRLGLGYAMYFNEKHKRSGALFQGRYKAKHIDSNEYLLYVSAYVNLNDRVHGLNRKEDQDPELFLSRSSWGEYQYETKLGRSICETSIILDQFSDKKRYTQFALSALSQMKSKKESEKELKDLFHE